MTNKKKRSKPKKKAEPASVDDDMEILEHAMTDVENNNHASADSGSDSGSDSSLNREDSCVNTPHNEVFWNNGENIRFNDPMDIYNKLSANKLKLFKNGAQSLGRF